MYIRSHARTCVREYEFMYVLYVRKYMYASVCVCMCMCTVHVFEYVYVHVRGAALAATRLAALP